MRRDGKDPRLATLSGRLDYLFDSLHPFGRPRYTYREVSEMIKRDQGFDVSAAYINQLCTGKKDNPGVQQIKALARFFGVPTKFLIGEEDVDVIAEQIEELKAVIVRKGTLEAIEDAMGDPGVRLLALQARGMSEPHRGLVSVVLDQLRQLQGLGESHPDKPSP